MDGVMGVMGLAFGVGMLHALDADHIAAVSGLACGRDEGRNKAVRHCVHWALGHGLVLLLVGVTVLLLGAAIPESLSALAESLVGVVLILIGLSVLWDLQRQGARLDIPPHSDTLTQLHWQKPGHGDANNPERQHGALLVGMLHGMAGSAPLLALFPVALQRDPLHGLFYLLIFGFGVLLAMLIFGGLLQWMLRHTLQRFTNLFTGLRVSVALFSIGFGGFLLYGLR